MTTNLSYYEEDSFKRDFKKLQKRFITLFDDLAVAKRNAIDLFHLKNINTAGIVQIPGYPDKIFKIYKLRKFACKALKGRGAKTGLRIIYAYDTKTWHIYFIEIYFKSDQENENKDKIQKFLTAICRAAMPC